MPISASIRHALYYIFLIPSILSSVFVLFHLLCDQNLRRTLTHHVIIVILILGLIFALTDVVWLIYYYHVRTALVLLPSFCLIWVFIDVAGFVTVTMLVAWGSIERHILIFHHHWLATARRRLWIHYLPIAFFLFYPLFFYSFIFFWISCDQPFDYSIIRYGYSYCGFRYRMIGQFDSIMHNVMSVVCIVVSSMLLLARIIWQRCHLRRRIRWCNYRRMAIPLLSISTLYLFFYFPPTVFDVLYIAGVSLNEPSDDYYGSSMYFTPHIFMMIPLVTLISIPEIRTKLKLNQQCYQRLARAPRPKTRTNTRIRSNPIAAAIPTMKF